MSLPLRPVTPPRAREQVLVIDPGDPAGRTYNLALGAEDRNVHVCTSAQEGLALLADLRPDVVVAALDTADLPGLRLLESIRHRAPGVPVITLAGHPTVEGAVQALRAGAVDYLGRPVSPGLLSEKVIRALGAARTSRQLIQAQKEASDKWGFSSFLSRSPRMVEVFNAIRAVAGTDATVLIRGETGTGKELVARALHDRSRRRARNLVSVNCGAFTETLLESELFGHEKGSFTGAMGRRAGVFEMADGGSLFLDELGETSLSVQVNLLRVLEEMRFRRVGGTDPIDVDVRIIAATNVDLETAVTSGRFREDLFYRLNVFPVTLPPLRERPEDIPILTRHFLTDAAEEYELEAPAAQPEAMELILRYRWPGNVRQLRALCERWVIQCSGRELRVEDLPAELRRGGKPDANPSGVFIDDSVPLPQLTERVINQVERAYMHRQLVKHKGHLIQTAAACGITRRTLFNRMKALGLAVTDYK
ncbi:MAG: sigma-54-dependent Fis family transcriptional regulator [Myxococcales bacterium]|nr:sigma-54-dependent Fis family transcriptional regulator [Myxococcales bacterium]